MDMNAAGQPDRDVRRAFQGLRRWTRLGIVLVLAVPILIGWLAQYEDAPAISDQTQVPAPSFVTEWSMGPEESEVFVLDLEAERFVRVVAVEQGVDVVLRLRDPHGNLVAEADSPTSGYGTEELVGITRASGLHRLEVVSFPGPGLEGCVELTRHPPRSVEPHHRRWVAAVERLQEIHGLFWGGRFDAAARGGMELLAVWLELGHTRQQSATLRLLGRAQVKLRDFESAERSFRQALVLAHALGDAYGTANLLTFLGQARLELGKVMLGFEATSHAQVIYSDLQLHREESLALLQMGSYQQRLGNLGRALENHEASLAILDHADPQLSYFVTWVERSHAYTSYGALLLDLNRLGDAQFQFKRAEALYRERGQPVQQAEIVKRLAYILFRTGEFDQAKALVLESRLKLEKMSRTPSLQKLVATLLLLQGRIELAQQRESESKKSLEQALGLFQETGNLPAQGTSYLELGRVLTSQNAPEAALRNFDRAHEIFGRFGATTSQTIVDLRRAEALLKLGKLEEAWQRTRSALVLAEAHREVSKNLDDRAEYFAFRQEFFEIGIETLMALHAEDPGAGYDLQALELHDSRRSRSLLDVLLRSVEPQEPSQDIASVSALPLDELETDTSLVLVYCLLDGAGHLWALDEGQVQYFALPSSGARIEAWARQYAEHLARRSASRVDRRRDVARHLSSNLLQPVGHLLEGKRRLVIVAEGELQTIPFGALPVPGGGDHEYLIRHHEIVALPSLSSWVRLRLREAGRSPPKQEGLILGDPVFARHDPRIRKAQAGPPTKAPQDQQVSEDHTQRLRGIVEPLKARGLPRLPATGREVESVTHWLGVDQVEAHVGLSADRNALFRPDVADFRILHLATHAFQDAVFPEQSSVVLSLVDGLGNPSHGWVRASEIAQMKLHAELVVLSGCETARGKLIPGEGVLGLTRAFFEAGAPRVVSSLWKVDDGATAKLMDHFYEAYTKSGQPPPAALRTAQLRMLEHSDFEEPFYWASFVFQGDWKRPEKRARR